MDKTCSVKVSFGEFTFKNILAIGEQNQIAAHRSTVSNGMYGQMVESPNPAEVNAALTIFRSSEMQGRIIKYPEDWMGCDALMSEEFDELWKAWTEKSGLFRRTKPDAAPDPGDGDGEDQS